MSQTTTADDRQTDATLYHQTWKLHTILSDSWRYC